LKTGEYYSPEIPELVLPTLEELGLELHLLILVLPFKSRRRNRGINAVESLFYETKKSSVYKETRNGMVGEDYSSKLLG
jgi:deoxyribodipyrimidine photo-lyase